MASDVDICNIALALLGDQAAVTSINPPDQSTQAGYCSRFYPIARDALLEMHAWGFSTTRAALAEVNNPSSSWKYAYATPSDVLNYLEVIDPEVADDYSVGLQMPNTIPGSLQSGLGIYAAQPYQIETDPVSGAQILLTNQENAVLRYTRSVSDPTQFSPLFIEALALLLSAKLAGVLIRGADGRAAAREQLAAFTKFKEWAVESDSNQRRVLPAQGASWMVNR